MSEIPMSLHDFDKHLRGFIWQGDDQPIIMSTDLPGELGYVTSPQITAAIRAKAAERGVRIGDLVDELNRSILDPVSPYSVTMKFDSMTREQMDSLGKMFGLDTTGAS